MSITDLEGNRLTRFPKRGPYGSQRALAIHLSLLPECWDYKRVLPTPKAGDPTQAVYWVIFPNQGDV